MKKQPELIVRIVCDCGWYNNKPHPAYKHKKRCKKCGKLVDPQERFKEEMTKRIKVKIK